ncbi:MAG: hypothetical protein OEZ01_02355 [Candidatus Heimdallarchaeota archaeon]|nr:hypothetical protein [Candidatus Heimdallarchaeota archaeon]MDH5644818.1 hypothetical protein [Candidatus Heimdallarchaeota archaeon]
MATSIKIKDSTKKQLDELQARILLEFGIKLNHQEIMERVIRLGSENINLVMMETKPLTKEKVDHILSLSQDFGIKTDPDLIDDILYGGEND